MTNKITNSNQEKAFSLFHFIEKKFSTVF